MGGGAPADAPRAHHGSNTLPWRTRTDWVVVRADPGVVVPAEARAVIAGPCPVDHGVDPGDPVRIDPRPGLGWEAAHGGTLVAAWGRDDLANGAAWHVDPAGVTVLRGQLRWFGEPWRPPGTWAALHAARRPTDRFADPFADLVGDGTVVSLDGDGRGVIAADRTGIAAVYRAHGHGYVVYASGAELAARCARPVGTPQRDATTAAWLAHTGFLVGRATGFAGVETLRPGALVRLEPGVPVAEVDADPWADRRGLSSLDPSDLADVVAEAVVDQVRAAASLGEPALLDLTGGKDSRLVLAMALGAGLLDDVELRTVGPPQLSDVRLAAGIAGLLGRPHVGGHDGRRPPGAFVDRTDRFVARTEGMVTAWSAKLRTADDGRVRLSGVVGEALRADMTEGAWVENAGAAERANVEAMAEFVIGLYRRGSAGFVRPEVATELDRRLRSEVADDPTARSDPEVALAAYFLRHRGARYGGPLLDHDRDHRVWALFSLRSVQAAHALPLELRRGEWLHHELIRRIDPRLATLAFDGPGWAGGYVSDPVPVPPPPVPSEGPDPRPPKVPAATVRDGKPADIMFQALRRPDEERRAFFTSVVEDTTNPLWEVVDHQRVAAAVEGLDDLSDRHRRQLYSVATGAVWLRGATGAADRLRAALPPPTPSAPSGGSRLLRLRARLRR